MKQAQPPLEFIPQAYNPLILKAVHLFLPLALKFRFRRWLPAGIFRVDTANVETFVELLKQFQLGKIRLLMAFRHCEVDDPLCGLYLMSRVVPKIARQQGISLEYPIHSHFMYDRGMPLWGGKWLGWVLSRLGGVPVHRGKKLDLQALKRIRDLLINGKMPVLLAPEGATNGHSELISSFEPGVAQLGFWAMEDLKKAQRVEDVVILPINIQYGYINPEWSKLDRLLSQLEADCGLTEPISASNNQTDFYYRRLFRLGEYLLTEMENFYRQFYHQKIPQPPETNSPNQLLEARLQALLDISLKTAEEYFVIPSKGSIIDRCRRLEEAGWNYIYRNDFYKFNTLQKGLADWVASEASSRMHHMRLVESFVAVTGTYVLEKPTFERFAETTLILFDLVARIKNRNLPPRRPRLGKRWVRMSVGEPISLGERWPNYKQNHQSAKQTVNQLTQDLQLSLQNLII